MQLQVTVFSPITGSQVMFATQDVETPHYPLKRLFGQHRMVGSAMNTIITVIFANTVRRYRSPFTLPTITTKSNDASREVVWDPAPSRESEVPSLVSCAPVPGKAAGGV